MDNMDRAINFFVYFFGLMTILIVARIFVNC